MRFEKEKNIYGDEAVLKRFQANETSIAVVQGKISALISESELVELENSNATMYSKLASAIMDIDSLTLNFSDLTTKYNTVSGQYTSLDSKVAQYKASVDGLEADITSVQQNISKNYSTTTQMNAAITAKANEITAELSAVRTTLQNDYSTTTAMNAAIKASVDGLSSTVSKTYATTTQLNTAKSDAISTAKSYTDSAKSSALTTAKGYADAAENAANSNTENLLKNYSTTIQMNSAITQKVNSLSATVSSTYATKTSLASATSRITTLETWKNEASLKITDSAIVSTVTSSTAWSDKVNVNQIGTLIQQNANSVKIAWNNISKYIQFESGSLAIYNGAVSTSQKRAVFDQDGIHFWRDGYYVGKIGTNRWVDNDAHKGLVFDLEYQAKYMAWAYKKSESADVYSSILTFSRDNSICDYLGLWLGADLYANGYNIYIGENKNRRIFNYSNGIGIRSNDNIFLEIGSTNILSIDSGGVYTNKLLEIGNGGGITAYNNTKLNFYSDLNMHNFSVLNNSDERLKENISDPDISAIDVVYGMQVCQYDWRGSGNHVSAGLIAQQVMEIVPEAVKQDGDGLYAIDYISLIPYLIGAIQYLYEVQMKKKNKKAKYVIEEYSEEEISEALRKAAAPVQIKKEKIRVVPESVKFKMK